MNNKMPAIFIGHGSPMNALEHNGFTDVWSNLGRDLPRPRAVLVISAHWYLGATAVTTMEWPRTIHDFFGFPPELFAFNYPAPGSPWLAEEVAEVVKPDWVGFDHDQWGLDHGTWSVLTHLYPNADISGVQLSINALQPLEYHMQLGARLAPLRERGVMILGSGDVVHNLQLVQWNQPNAAFAWAERFDDFVAGQLDSEPGAILKMTQHPDYDLAVPTPDHLIPLLYIAALAAEEGTSATALLRGHALGSISMSCYGVGGGYRQHETAVGAATLPRGIPPDQTNM